MLSPAIKIKGEDGDSVNTGLNEVDVFNMLTNNGEKQGIFPWYATDIDPETGETMEKEQVYINAERIKVGVLSGRMNLYSRYNPHQNDDRPMFRSFRIL